MPTVSVFVYRCFFWQFEKYLPTSKSLLPQRGEGSFQSPAQKSLHSVTYVDFLLSDGFHSLDLVSGPVSYYYYKLGISQKHLGLHLYPM